MDVFTLTKSKTRQKILDLFLSNPDKDYYLRELEKELSISAGNIRREFLHLQKSGLFGKYNKGRLIYYKINTESPLFHALKMLMNQKIQPAKNIIDEGLVWMTKPNPYKVSQDYYCQTRDIFQVRLQSFGLHLEKSMGTDAYLLTAVAGEIGNNSFDHNLGMWPDIPGIFFTHVENKKIIVLADRGLGILKTIRNVKPNVANDLEALKVAFTQIISGRFDEKRGNGLKFVTQVIRGNKWSLLFDSGIARLTINDGRDLKINEEKRNIKGCFTVIEY